MIVDDTPFNIMVLKSLLQFADNLEIDAANNGLMALEKI